MHQCSDAASGFAVTLQSACAVAPDKRWKWLNRALEAASKGDARASDLFDVISHPRFDLGISGGQARRMLNEIQKQSDIFPGKLRDAVRSAENLGIAKLAATAPPVPIGPNAEATAQDIMDRCVDFVRKNEDHLEEVRSLDERCHHVVLTRASVQEVWGLTWCQEQFAQRRRVLLGIIPGTPAGRWNDEQRAAGGFTLEPGDELVAVGGRWGFEEMATIRDLTEAALTVTRTSTECGIPTTQDSMVHVFLKRKSVQEVWGLTWCQQEFAKRRRVIMGIVPGTPAAAWNEDRRAAGGVALQPGDELVAVGGRTGWDEMAAIRELTGAALSFVRAPRQTKVTQLANNGSPSSDGSEALPPRAKSGEYTTDAGGGWKGLANGKWLFSESEGVYFNVPTGTLYTDDATSPTGFRRVGVDSGTPAEGADLHQGEMAEISACRLLGRMRWFSSAKGFGFLSPWRNDGGADIHTNNPDDDLFVHHTQVLEGLSETGQCDASSTQLAPGAPVTYFLAEQENGKSCAAQVCLVEDLTPLCQVGFSGGPSARRIAKAGLDVKAYGGQSTTGIFTGIAAGRRGVGGAEYIALNMSRDVASCLRGREQTGERGVRASLAAGLRRTQHEYLQYAQKLSDNSASVWLSAETVSCTALVYAPEHDGRPLVVVATVGGGKAVVGRRDGNVSARFAGESRNCPAASKGTAGLKDSKTGQESVDILKVFEHGLKGPAISFPKMSRAVPVGSATVRRGFGVHAWTERDGSSANLEFELESASLDWQDDAVLIIGTEGFWASFVKEEDVVRSALHYIQRSAFTGPDAAEKAADELMELARASRKGRTCPDNAAVSVMRLGWCPLAALDASPLPSTSRSPVPEASEKRKIQDSAQPEGTDDMFAPMGGLAGNSIPACVMDSSGSAGNESDSDELPQNPTRTKKKARKEDTLQEHPNVVRPSLDSSDFATADAPCPVGSNQSSEQYDAEGVCKDVSSDKSANTDETSFVSTAGLDDMFAEFCREVDGIR